MPLYDLSNMEEKKIFEGCTAKILHGDQLTVTHVRIKANSVVSEHHHAHEQIMNLIEGEFFFTVDGVEHRMKAGEAFVIPSNVPHAVKAITDCYVIDVFYPCREDFK